MGSIPIVGECAAGRDDGMGSFFSWEGSRTLRLAKSTGATNEAFEH